MEVRIKDNNGYVDADWTIEDGVMVVLPKVEKFEPKDGDVVTYFNDDKPTVYIYKSGHKYNTFFYAAYSSSLDSCLLGKGEHLSMNRSDIRPATEEEKKLLFDKLKEEGYEWDAEKKEVVKIKWKPSYKGEYYFKPRLDMGQFIAHRTKWLNDEADNAYDKKGWIFKTNKECQEFCYKLNQAIKGV
jgi:hypothetical protein